MVMPASIRTRRAASPLCKEPTARVAARRSGHWRAVVSFRLTHKCAGLWLATARDGWTDAWKTGEARTVDAELRAELLRRVAKDQTARQARDWDVVRAVDTENLPWLKQVIAEHGWPGRTLAGADGAHSAWLLVQHADP